MTCSSDLTIKLWDTAEDYKNVKTLYGHDHSVSAARFLPSGDFIVSASRDRMIKIWEVATGYVELSSQTSSFRPADRVGWLKQVLHENAARPHGVGAIRQPFV